MLTLIPCAPLLLALGAMGSVATEETLSAIESILVFNSIDAYYGSNKSFEFKKKLSEIY